MCLTDLRNDIHEFLIDILQGGSITIVIDIQLDQSLRILTDSNKDTENQRFLSNGRMSHFEYRDKDLVQQDFNLFLNHQQSLRCLTHLHLSTHRFEHTPKDLDTEFKDLVDRTDGVPR